VVGWFHHVSSFVAFGIVPLMAYVVTAGMNDVPEQALFFISCGLTFLMLFVLGVCKSWCTSQSWYASGLEIALFGSFTACVSYMVGWLVDSLVHS